MLAKTFERVASFRVEAKPVDDDAMAEGDMNKFDISYDHVSEESNNLRLSSDIYSIKERMNYAVDVVAMSPANQAKNRSPDLVPLTANYVQMKNDLLILMGVLKTYQKRTRDVQESRLKVAEQLALLSKRTPIYEEVGRQLHDDTKEKIHLRAQQVFSPPSPSLSTTSLSSSSSHSTPKPPSSVSFFLQSMGLVQEDTTQPIAVAKISEACRNKSDANAFSLQGIYSLAAAQAVNIDADYQVHVVEYTTKWMKTVCERVDFGLEHVRKLASERLHYERKVETLRNRANDLQGKGKTSPDSAIERLSRNETKLKEAFAAHEKEAGKLCALIETVTCEGYKDLYIIVRNYIEWERNRMGKENDISIHLEAILKSLNAKF